MTTLGDRSLWQLRRRGNRIYRPLTKARTGLEVPWHQDGHYFGTASTQIISVAVYLEETTRENGCLRVIPGSHLGGVAAHHPGEGADAQGEWAAPDEQQAEDVEVHAGSVVLFNSMLMHGAHKNRSEKRTRFSLFGHFVP